MDFRLKPRALCFSSYVSVPFAVFGAGAERSAVLSPYEPGDSFSQFFLNLNEKPGNWGIRRSIVKFCNQGGGGSNPSAGTVCSGQHHLARLLRSESWGRAERGRQDASVARAGIAASTSGGLI